MAVSNHKTSLFFYTPLTTLLAFSSHQKTTCHIRYGLPIFQNVHGRAHVEQSAFLKTFTELLMDFVAPVAFLEISMTPMYAVQNFWTCLCTINLSTDFQMICLCSKVERRYGLCWASRRFQKHAVNGSMDLVSSVEYVQNPHRC
jgi:hypothetical protein